MRKPLSTRQLAYIAGDLLWVQSVNASDLPKLLVATRSVCPIIEQDSSHQTGSDDSVAANKDHSIIATGTVAKSNPDVDSLLPFD